MRTRVFAALLAFALLAIPAAAQEQSGAIQGTVKDAQGGVLPGVTVEVKNQATGAVQSTVSDAAGGTVSQRCRPDGMTSTPI
jgi:hypothetical protein